MNGQLFEHPVADAVVQSEAEASDIQHWLAYGAPEQIMHATGLSRPEAREVRQEVCSMPVGKLALLGRLESKEPMRVLSIQENPKPIVVPVEYV